MATKLSLVKLSAAVKTAVLSASASSQFLTAYAKATFIVAAAVTGDFIKFRKPFDYIATTELFKTVLEKILSSEVGVSDNEVRDFEKVREDAASTADFRFNDLLKSRDDHLDAIDAHTSELNKSKADEIQTADNKTADLQKQRVSFVSTEDVQESALDKPLASNHFTSDTHSARLNKRFYDLIDAGDEVNTTVSTDDGQIASLEKPFNENAVYADDYVLVSEKAREELLNALDLAAVITEKPFTDTILNGDNNEFQLEKPFQEALFSSDSDYYVLTKERSDSLETSNDLDFSFEKPFLDNTFAPDHLTNELAKPFEDSNTVGDVATAAPTKGLFDPTQTTESLTLVSLFHRLFDESQSATEVYENNLHKEFFENLTAEDAVYFGREYGRMPGELYAAVDEINEFQIHKHLVSNHDTTDLAAPHLEKPFFDVIGKSDDYLFEFDKAPTDDLLTFEGNILTLDKICVDMAAVSEEANAFLQNYVAGNYFATDYVGNRFALT
jgi:hypothetical protein